MFIVRNALHNVVRNKGRNALMIIIVAIIILCVWCLLLHMFVGYICAVLSEARRGHWILELKLQAAVWVLRAEPRSSGKAASALNC